VPSPASPTSIETLQQLIPHARLHPQLRPPALLPKSQGLPPEEGKNIKPRGRKKTRSKSKKEKTK